MNVKSGNSLDEVILSAKIEILIHYFMLLFSNNGVNIVADYIPAGFREYYIKVPCVEI